MSNNSANSVTTEAFFELKKAYEQLSLEKKKLSNELLASHKKYDHLSIKYKNLEFELGEIKRMVFGKKSERFKEKVEVPNQPMFDFGDDADDDKEPEKITVTYERNKKKKKKKRGGRMSLPDALPREVVVLEPEEEVSGLDKIGEEVYEMLEYKPGSLYVKRFIRPKYARRSDNGQTKVTIAPPAKLPIPGGLAGPGVLAHVFTLKYVYHLPIYRTLKMFRNNGVSLSESTVGNWQNTICELLEPLSDLHRKDVLGQRYLMNDDTIIRVQDKKKKSKTHTGYFWISYAPEQKLALFTYEPGRGGIYPKKELEGYKGLLQTDGLAVYDQFKTNTAIKLFGCMAHARRRFFKARKLDPGFVEPVLRRFKALYKLEQEARDENLSADERYALRQEKAKPVWKELVKVVREKRPQTIPKSPLGEAITYFANQKEELERYLDYGLVEIDNNLIENQVRPVAIGRKNYLFAGSHNAARKIAMLYSFFGTCKQHGINPEQWLKDVLTRIPSCKMSQLHTLLPQNWQETNPEKTD